MILEHFFEYYTRKLNVWNFNKLCSLSAASLKKDTTASLEIITQGSKQ